MWFEKYEFLKELFLKKEELFLKIPSFFFFFFPLGIKSPED